MGLHAGITKMWNRAGIRPEACDFLERRAQLFSEQQPRVWRGGNDVPSVERHHKAIRNTSPTSSGSFVSTNKSCWTAFLTFQTCSRPGLCCCTALLPVQTTSSVWFRLSCLRNSPIPTTRHCGGVCQQCWGCHQHCATHMFVTQSPFFWLLEGWDCGAQVGRPFQRMGELG